MTIDFEKMAAGEPQEDASVDSTYTFVDGDEEDVSKGIFGAKDAVFRHMPEEYRLEAAKMAAEMYEKLRAVPNDMMSARADMLNELREKGETSITPQLHREIMRGVVIMASLRYTMGLIQSLANKRYFVHAMVDFTTTLTAKTLQWYLQNTLQQQQDDPLAALLGAIMGDGGDVQVMSMSSLIEDELAAKQDADIGEALDNARSEGGNDDDAVDPAKRNGGDTAGDEAASG